MNEFVREQKETTISGYLKNLENAIDEFFIQIKDHPLLENRSLLTLKSISELYILSTSKYTKNIQKWSIPIKDCWIAIGEKLIENFETATQRVFKLSKQIIHNH